MIELNVGPVLNKDGVIKIQHLDRTTAYSFQEYPTGHGLLESGESGLLLPVLSLRGYYVESLSPAFDE